MIHSGKFSPSRTRGFTLIEILVVIVIVGISVSVMVLRLAGTSDEDEAQKEILRLKQLMEFTQEQAVIRGQEYGVRFYKSGYRFMQYDTAEEGWIDIRNSRFLHSRQLDEAYELDLYIEQLPVDLLDSQEDDPQPEEKESELETIGSHLLPEVTPESEKIRPQVFLLSSSELTPAFEIRLRIPGTDIEKFLHGLPQGILTQERLDE